MMECSGIEMCSKLHIGRCSDPSSTAGYILLSMLDASLTIGRAGYSDNLQNKLLMVIKQ